MEKVRIADVDNSIQPAAVMRQLTQPLDLTDVAVNYYELDPGDSFSYAYHSHEIQEEVFFVFEGTATFETEDGPVTVEAGDIVRFGREELQRGWNRGSERVKALALGAPLEYGEQRKLRYCPACDEETENRLEDTDEEPAVVARCEDCGAETGRWYRGPMPGEVP